MLRAFQALPLAFRPLRRLLSPPPFRRRRFFTGTSAHTPDADVEGGEAAVLRHSNLSAVSVILLEDDGANRTRQDAIRGLLEGAGLVHTHALRSGRRAPTPSPLCPRPHG